MPHDFVLVGFKGNRREIFINPLELQLNIGDHVITEADKGEDLGTVLQMGRLVSIKSGNKEPGQVLRKASTHEIDLLWKNREKEISAYYVCREKIKKFDLNMKLVDVEYQFDHNKITFYFTSDRRVDFRDLVKDLASKYRTRIELRQIGVRDEAKRIGGFGICGRQLCCSQHLQCFEPISTQYVKDQMLPMNPGKLSGNCGRLKCCLAYERGQYLEALEKFPHLGQTVKTPQGSGIVAKNDVFAQLVTVRLQNKSDDEAWETFPLNKLKFAREEVPEDKQELTIGEKEW